MKQPAEATQFNEDDQTNYVYFLTQLGHVIYVGQTMSLRNRISHHRRRRQMAFDGVFFIVCSEEDVMGVETKWINELKPLYNVIKEVSLNKPI